MNPGVEYGGGEYHAIAGSHIVPISEFEAGERAI